MVGFRFDFLDRRRFILVIAALLCAAWGIALCAGRAPLPGAAPFVAGAAS